MSWKAFSKVFTKSARRGWPLEAARNCSRISTWNSEIRINRSPWWGKPLEKFRTSWNYLGTFWKLESLDSRWNNWKNAGTIRWKNWKKAGHMVENARNMWGTSEENGDVGKKWWEQIEQIMEHARKMVKQWWTCGEHGEDVFAKWDTWWVRSWWNIRVKCFHGNKWWITWLIFFMFHIGQWWVKWCEMMVSTGIDMDGEFRVNFWHQDFLPEQHIWCKSRLIT